MVKRVVRESVTVSRGTETKTIMIGDKPTQVERSINVRPVIGTVFDFTKEEVDFFTEHRPSAISKLVNEAGQEKDDPVVEAVDPKTATGASTGKKAADGGAAASDASDL